MEFKKWQFWLGVLISVVFIWLSLRGLQLGEFWETVKQANYWWLIPGVGVYFVGVWARAWRWHYLLKPIKEISTRKIFPITTIGYMGNNIYPARAGEVLRAVILKRKEGVPISASLATIIIERQMVQCFARDLLSDFRLRPVVLKQLEPAELPQARDTPERITQAKLQ